MFLAGTSFCMAVPLAIGTIEALLIGAGWEGHSATASLIKRRKKMQRNELSKYLAKYLNTEKFNDYCPNGLQVEGKSNISKIIIGVSASVELFQQAIKEKVDAVIVHHGIIWNYERPVYIGGYRERVKLLLENNINLYAFHLPLDAHPIVGNNAKLAKLLNVKSPEPFGDHKGNTIGFKGKIAKTDKDKFFNKVKSLVNRDVLVFPYGPDKITNIGIISGDAQKEFNQAVAEGLDAYITGEVREHVLHYAKEEKIHFISAGHYATEQFGIKALGKHLQKKFKLKIKFIDIPNPV